MAEEPHLGKVSLSFSSRVVEHHQEADTSEETGNDLPVPDAGCSADEANDKHIEKAASDVKQSQYAENIGTDAKWDAAAALVLVAGSEIGRAHV